MGGTATKMSYQVVRDLIKELRIGRIQMSLSRRKLFLLGRKRNMIGSTMMLGGTASGPSSV